MSPRSGEHKSSKSVPVTATGSSTTGSSSSRSAAVLRRGGRSAGKTAAASVPASESVQQVDGAEVQMQEDGTERGDILGLHDGNVVFQRTVIVTETTTVTTTMSWTERNQWVVYALASGACAAFNGVFAKLTTNDLTTQISEGISRVLGLEGASKMLEIIVRCIFFGLNLAFNGVMWTLFTQALAKGTSTTQVSIMNTSTNFIITALLGLFIFSESLPPLWWVGATLLVAGNVIIGRKDGGHGDAQLEASERERESNEDRDENELREGEEGEGEREGGELGREGVGGVSPEEKSDDDEDVPLLGNLEVPPYT